MAAFADSVGDWPAFPDSSDALARLHRRFRLGVITNCDDDLFARSAARLGIDFDWVVTAQQVGGYKPDQRNFELAFERLGLPRERILHVAQSLYHDHVTAKRLGLSTVWIDRRHGRPGAGATPPADATPGRDLPGHGLVRGGGHDVVRQEGRPAGAVAVAPRLTLGAERLPAAMLDLDQGRRRRPAGGSGSRPRSRRRGRGGGATGRRAGSVAPRR